jgi:hypothetical protein
MKKFILRGKQYQLSRADVERATVNLQPKPGEKYVVEIGGARFPPKQLLAESLKISASTFTTIDANRILGKLGFEIVLFSPLSPLSPPNGTNEIKVRLDSIDRRLDDLIKLLNMEQRLAAVERKLEERRREVPGSF